MVCNEIILFKKDVILSHDHQTGRKSLVTEEIQPTNCVLCEWRHSFIANTITNAVSEHYQPPPPTRRPQVTEGTKQKPISTCARHKVQFVFDLSINIINNKRNYIFVTEEKTTDIRFLQNPSMFLELPASALFCIVLN